MFCELYLANRDFYSSLYLYNLIKVFFMESLISKYLIKNKYNYTNFEEFKENYLSHPNYPSLYAVTDSLKLMGIENLAAIVPKNQFQNLPNIFITSLVIENKTEFFLVEKKQDKIIYINEKGKQKTVTIDEFKNICDGLILAIETNEKAQSQTKFSKQNILIIVCSVLLILFGLSLWLQSFDLIPFLYQLLSVAGIFTGVFIIQEELGNANNIVTKICNGTDNTVSCNSVINSKEGKLPFGIVFSDLPILFFGVSFLLISFNYSSYPLIGLLSVFALPVIFYSVYLQKYNLKKWCMLCLAVSGIVIIQAGLYSFTSKVFSWETAIIYALVFLISTVLWLPLKNTLKQKNTLSRENSELKRFKRDFNVFDLLLNKSEITSTIHLQGIAIGNTNAPVLLELLVSPSCGFCYRAYKNCTELLEKQKEKVQLKVYFNLNIDNAENPYLTIAENVM